MTKTAFPLTQLATERRLRIFREPCWGDAPVADREWFVELRGVAGTIYGNNATSFWLDTTSGRASVFSEMGPLQAIVSPGGREARFLLDITAFDAVLGAFGPRKRRMLSAERRKNNVERLKAYQFSRK